VSLQISQGSVATCLRPGGCYSLQYSFPQFIPECNSERLIITVHTYQSSHEKTTLMFSDSQRRQKHAVYGCTQ